MKTTPIGKNNCPACNHIYYSATSISDSETPNPMDLCICVNCIKILQFTHDMDLQVLPKVVFDSFEPWKKKALRKAQFELVLTKLFIFSKAH